MLQQRKRHILSQLILAIAVMLAAVFASGCSDTQLVTEDKPQQVVLSVSGYNCDPTTGDETEDGMRGETQDITATQTVQIFLNDSYKIKDMKFV